MDIQAHEAWVKFWSEMVAIRKAALEAAVKASIKAINDRNDFIARAKAAEAKARDPLR